MNNFYVRFSRRKFILTAGATALGTTVLKGCTSYLITTGQAGYTPTASQAQQVTSNNESALYEAAKKEGKLVYYSSFFNQVIMDEIGAAFTNKYPEIQFEGIRKVSGTLFQQLNQEIQSGIRNCDIYSTGDISYIMQLNGQGKLLQYEPAGKENVLAEFRNLNPGNFYQTAALLPVVIGYNTQKIQAAEVPKGWKDLLSAQYKDKIATGSGVVSDQVGPWALAMEQKFGWDNYFLQFNQLNPKLGRSINDAITDLVSGERAIAVVPLGQTLAAKAKGNPVEVIYPTEGTVVVVGSGGILKNAPHQNAAKLFMNFLMGKEYSQVVAKYFEQPLRGDVTVTDAKPLKDMNPIVLTPEQVKAGTPKIKTKWKDEFGA